MSCAGSESRPGSEGGTGADERGRSETGTAFLVAHTNPRFKNEVLPTNYGHNNYASFTFVSFP